MKFKKKDLQELVFDESELLVKVEENMVEQRRWVTAYECIFQDTTTKKCYQTNYDMGSTEYQESEPFEYDKDEIECVEVYQIEQLVKVWRKVQW